MAAEGGPGMYGLVLEGGGARGAYQIGACKALQELGLQIGAVTGTSVGALNAAMVVQGDIDKTWHLWENISPARILAVDEERLLELRRQHLNTSNLPYYLKRFREILGDGGLDVTPLRALLEENIDENKVRQSAIDLGIVTVSVSDFKPLELFIKDIPEGRLVDYLMASAGLPVFKPELVDGKRFIDGGFHDNLPINLMISRGFTDIIVIRTFGPGRVRKVMKKGLHVKTISPVDDLGGILDFDGDLAKRNLQLGYFDALKLFQGLNGQRYYLDPQINEEFFLQMLINLPEKKVLSIGKRLGFKGLPYRRMLFEQIIPQIRELFKIDRKADYAELSILLLEEIAARHQVDRFKIYTLEEFLAAIKAQYTPQRERVRPELPDLLKKGRLAPLLAREEIINEVIYQLFEEIL
jgi:NTE family protein